MSTSVSIYAISRLSTGEVQAIIERLAPQFGLVAVWSDHNNGEWRARFCQRNPWHSILIHQHTQQLTCALKESEHGTVLDLDKRFFGWYRVVVLCCSVSWSLLLLIGLSSLFSLTAASPPSSCLWAMLASCSGVLLMRVVSTLVRTDGCLFLHALRKEIASRRGLLEEKRIGMRSSENRTYLTLFVILLLVILASICMNRAALSHLAPTVLIVGGLLVGQIALLVAVFIMAIRHPAAGLRLEIAFTSLQNALVFATITTGLCSAMVFGLPSQTSWNQMLTGRSMIDRSEMRTVDEYSTVGHGDWSGLANIEEHRQLMWIPFALISASIIVAGVYAASNLRSVGPIVRLANRLQEQLAGETTHAAVSGISFFKLTRLLVIGVWCFIGSYIALSITCIVLTGIAGIDPVQLLLDQRSVGVPQGTAMELAFAFSLPTPGPRLLLLSHLFWTASAIGILALLALSFLSYCGPRWSTLHRLRFYAAKHREADKQVEINDMLIILAGRAGCAPPKLVITPRSDPHAGAHEFGVMNPKRYVELSVRFLEILEREEIEALLAHELAHFIKGHCRKHNLLHLLARLTFVGGGGVSAVENSFGYELEADRTAVSHLGIKPEILRSCLEKTHVTLEMDSVMGRRLPVGLALVQTGDIMGMMVRWASGGHQGTLPRFYRLRCWLSVYASDTDVFSYWHPTLKERIATIKAIEAATLR